MADGDILKLGIKKPYAKAYREMCEGSGSAAEWARKVARGVKSFILNYGNAPQQLLDRVVSRLEAIMSSPSTAGPDEWSALDREIRRLPLLLRGRSKEGMDLASDACRSVVNDLEQGACFSDIREEVIRRFISRVYEATFTARVDAAPKHWDDIDKGIVDERMVAIDGEIQSYFDHFVKQMRTPLQKRPLRILRRRKPKVDLDTEFE